MNLWVEQAPDLMRMWDQNRKIYSLSISFSVSSHDFSSLCGSMPGFHPLHLPDPPCIGINITISTLYVLKRTPSASKCTPSNILGEKMWWVQLDEVFAMDQSLNCTEDCVPLTSLMRNWPTFQKQCLIGPLDCHSVFPKSLHEGKNSLGHFCTIWKVPEQTRWVTILTVVLGCTWVITQVVLTIPMPESHALWFWWNWSGRQLGDQQFWNLPSII